MAHQKSDRLWKFEDSWTKLEIYVVGYAYEPKMDQLRCDVLVNAKHFSGEYQVVIAWEEAMRFATECEALAAALAESRESVPAQLGLPADRPFLSICVAPAGVRKVRWQLVCRPAASPIEVLDLLVTTEYQLLNSIASGNEHVWKRWPGPHSLTPSGLRQRRTSG